MRNIPFFVIPPCESKAFDPSKVKSKIDTRNTKYVLQGMIYLFVCLFVCLFVFVVLWGLGVNLGKGCANYRLWCKWSKFHTNNREGGFGVGSFPALTLTHSDRSFD